MKTWIYLQNTFMNVTENNYELAMAISTFHVNALDSQNGDAFIASLLNAYQLKHNALVAAYTAWKNAGGSQKGLTLSLTQLLSQSTAMLNQWEPDITKLYPKTSPQYLELYPQGRTPFTNGKTDLRIAAFATLRDAPPMQNATLSAVKTAINDHWEDLQTARNAQLSSKTGTITGSQALEDARTNAMEQMYGNLGAFIQEYKTNPTTAEPYFDIARIRNHQQSIFTGSIEGNGIDPIFKHKMKTGQHLRLINDSDTLLLFYFTDGLADQPMPGPVAQVPPHSQQLIEPQQAGYTDDRRQLMVKNDTPTPGTWQVGIE